MTFPPIVPADKPSYVVQHQETPLDKLRNSPLTTIQSAHSSSETKLTPFENTIQMYAKKWEDMAKKWTAMDDGESSTSTEAAIVTQDDKITSTSDEARPTSFEENMMRYTAKWAAMTEKWEAMDDSGSSTSTDSVIENRQDNGRLASGLSEKTANASEEKTEARTKILARFDNTQSRLKGIKTENSFSTSPVKTLANPQKKNNRAPDVARKKTVSWSSDDSDNGSATKLPKNQFMTYPQGIIVNLPRPEEKSKLPHPHKKTTPGNRVPASTRIAFTEINYPYINTRIVDSDGTTWWETDHLKE